MYVCMYAVMAIRKAAWQYGGPVSFPMNQKLPQAYSMAGKTRVYRTESIASALGIMSPTEAVRWELDRRRRRREKIQRHNLPCDPEKGMNEICLETGLPEDFSGTTRVWDVH
jgi:hypothetical protein